MNDRYRKIRSTRDIGEHKRKGGIRASTGGKGLTIGSAEGNRTVTDSEHTRKMAKKMAKKKKDRYPGHSENCIIRYCDRECDCGILKPYAKEDRDMKKCDRPPEGWWCSRIYGHEGSCAARPTTSILDAAKAMRDIILAPGGNLDTLEKKVKAALAFDKALGEGREDIYNFMFDHTNYNTGEPCNCRMKDL